MPASGTSVWIRQQLWRVERARRDGGVLCLDVASQGRRRTFLAPFDRPAPAASHRRARRVGSRHAMARLSGLAARATRARALMTLVDARVDILPHQLEPALAVLEAAHRILIADEVGLGKTIQAGVILAEWRRRQPSLRALVVAPASLRFQWIDELRSRFGLHALVADSAALDRVARTRLRDEGPWIQPGLWVASLDYLKQPQVLDSMPLVPWDVVVVDEAHDVCGDSERHRAAQQLTGRARCVVLLTATPHNGDAAQFARLTRLGALPCRHDDLLIFRRTRGEVMTAPARRCRYHGVTLSLDETRVLDALAEFEAVVLRAAGRMDRATALLLLSVLRKRALSTMAALRQSLDRRLAWIDDAHEQDAAAWTQPPLIFDSDSDVVSPDERVSLRAVGIGRDVERSWLLRLRLLSETALRRDSKVARVARLIGRSREPVVVFTEFRDSLDAIRARLGSARRVAVAHGGLAPREQYEEIQRFLAGDASVLLATDVAGQGLNLQSRARWIVNVELPWNPVRLEQRAGRVDRIGQRLTVHITMLVARHRADEALLARLARRTRLAKQALEPSGAIEPSLDEASVRATILAGAPLESPKPAVVLPRLCRAWSRGARALARFAGPQRALARRWQTREPARGRPWGAAVRTGSPFGRLVAGGQACVFAVPVLDRSGAEVERHLLTLHLPPGLRCETNSARVADVAHRFAVDRWTRRVVRLGTVRREAAGRRASREQAVVLSMMATRSPSREVQAGLFDRRSVRAFDTATADLERMRRQLEKRLALLEDSTRLSIGRPTLEFIFTARP